jgi:hypothetical protein
MEERIDTLPGPLDTLVVVAPLLNADSRDFPISYPDTTSSGNALRKLRGDSVRAATTWGRTRVNAGQDRVFLEWPKDSAAFLGRRQGTLKVFTTDSARARDIPWTVELFLRQLTPPGRSRQEFWNVGGKAWGLGETENIFTYTTGTRVDSNQQVVFDTLVALHSRFRLAGPFAWEITVRRPALVPDGYTVMLFVTEEENPFLYFDDGAEPEFRILASQLGGLAVNVRRGSARVKAFGFQSQFSFLGLEAPNHARFFCRRDARNLSFRMRNLSAPAPDREIQAFSYAEGAMPDSVFLHFAVGNYQALGDTPVQVEWENLLITQGEIAP